MFHKTVTADRRVPASTKLRACRGLLIAVVALAFGALPAAANANTPVSGAAFTTTNTSADGTGHCKNGNENVNCNIYDGKEFVWLNGGPSTAYVGDDASESVRPDSPK